jgi:hypothetical protein
VDPRIEFGRSQSKRACNGSKESVRCLNTLFEM